MGLTGAIASRDLSGELKSLLDGDGGSVVIAEGLEQMSLGALNALYSVARHTLLAPLVLLDRVLALPYPVRLFSALLPRLRFDKELTDPSEKALKTEEKTRLLLTQVLRSLFLTMFF